MRQRAQDRAGSLVPMLMITDSVVGGSGSPGRRVSPPAAADACSVSLLNHVFRLSVVADRRGDRRERVCDEPGPTEVRWGTALSQLPGSQSPSTPPSRPPWWPELLLVFPELAPSGPTELLLFWNEASPLSVTRLSTRWVATPSGPTVA